MGIDARGGIAIVQIIFYIPILVASVIITLRHGFTKRAGWIMLLVLALIRIIGGAIHIASENNPSNDNLRITYSILEGAGLSPLLVATIGFLTTIAEHAFNENPLMEKGLRILGVMAIVGIVLIIVGGTQTASADGDISKLNQAMTLRHAGSIIFVVLFVLLVLVHLFFWANRRTILEHRRKLLIGISCALPFLGVRVIYGILSSYAPLIPTEKGGLSQFSLSTGSWGIYLGMSVLMEFAAVLIYTFVGITTPLQRDNQALGSSGSSPQTQQWEDSQQYPTHNESGYQYPPYRSS
ncbi:hypothetical protein QCA50_014995 [Cerrena zonata]|uniref:DUF7702 domain-containing protein n=1 Tax=Cerrena zonata TaxID=2478898 RepID=A0AAW0FMI4_9APHY